MEPTSYLAGGAAIAVVTACWGYVKGFSWRIISVFIEHTEVSGGKLVRALTGKLLRECSKSPFYDKTYCGTNEFLQNGRAGLVSYEMFGKAAVVFWIKWKWFIRIPIILSPPGSGAGSGGSGRPEENKEDDENARRTITVLRWTVDVEKLLVEASSTHNDQEWQRADDRSGKTRRFYIVQEPDSTVQTNKQYKQSNTPWWENESLRLLNFKPFEIGNRPDESGSALGRLLFPDHVNALIEEIKRWKDSKEWYHKHGIPWKRGWNLYGPPGTGKTALTRAIAEDMDLPLVVVSLGEVKSNDQLIKIWEKYAGPCIYLIEDIDNVFHGRTNIAARQRAMMPLRDESPAGDSPRPGRGEASMIGMEMGVTFDCLLNCIDGVKKRDGVFLVITTNDISKIDPALGVPSEDGTISTRPGRIDRAIHLKHMTPENKIIMANRILAPYPTELREVLTKISEKDELQTPAQFQELCCSIALRKYWEAKERGVAPESSEVVVAGEATEPPQIEMHNGDIFCAGCGHGGIRTIKTEKKAVLKSSALEKPKEDGVSVRIGEAVMALGGDVNQSRDWDETED